jgi:hypothetical protein
MSRMKAECHRLAAMWLSLCKFPISSESDSTVERVKGNKALKPTVQCLAYS